MSGFDYDVVVIGSGFGGSVAALRAAEKGYHELSFTATPHHATTELWVAARCATPGTGWERCAASSMGDPGGVLSRRYAVGSRNSRPLRRITMLLAATIAQTPSSTTKPHWWLRKAAAERPAPPAGLHER
jgi:choline dehydrogenase-like flavoprotein